MGNQALYERLEQVDPLAASQIHPHDTRRLIRALEVFRSTGEPISHHQLHFDEGRLEDECRLFLGGRPRSMIKVGDRGGSDMRESSGREHDETQNAQDAPEESGREARPPESTIQSEEEGYPQDENHQV